MNELVRTGVELVLDATGFNDKVEDTIMTIAKLKASMAFEGAITGLNQLSDSIKNSGLDAMAQGVYKVHEEFDALNAIATRVLENITDKAMAAGETLLKSITVEPLKAGLEEYETQINSVQTILANTGDALKEQGLESEHDRIEKINGVLDDLNKYADMTIYNFTEMTRNIGTFTAAGVELDTAATSIKGIANLAAMSGSNSQQASTAMYQLSQAIAAGSVKLQDWNSVVNAGMGGKLFQQELIDTAKAMGVADEQFVALTNGATTFRESLSSGWISAEVLTNTLEKFTAGSEGYTKAQIEQMQDLWRARGYSQKQIDELTGSVHQLTEEEEANLRTKWAEKGFNDEQIDHILDMGMAATDAATKVKTFSQLIDTVKEALQSGWTQSWEYIFGDFEQAKRFWTEISDLMNLYIGKSADSRNSMLKEWSEATYTYSEDGKLMIKQLNEETEAGYELVEVEKMENSLLGGREAVIQGLRNVFQGFLEVVLQLKEAFASNFWGTAENSAVSNIALSGQKLIDASHAFLDATQNFKDSLIGDNGEATAKLMELRGVFDYFAKGVRSAYDGLVKIGSSIGNVLSGMFGSIDIVSTLRELATMVNAVTLRFNAFGDIIAKHFGGGNNLNELTAFFRGLSELFMRNVWDKLEFIANGVMAIINLVDRMISPFGTASEILGSLGEKLAKFSEALFDLTHNADGSSKFDTMFNKIVDDFIKFYDVLRENVDFSGFTKAFTDFMTALSDDKVNVFNTFTKIFEIFANVAKVVLQILTPLGAAFANVFGDSFTKGAMFLASVIERFRAFSEALVANESTIKGLQHMFEGFFNVIKAIGEVIGGVFLSAWDTVSKLFGEIAPKGDAVGQTLTDVGDRLNGFAEIIRGFTSSGVGGFIGQVLSTLVHGIQSLFNVLSDFNPLEKFIGLLNSLGDGLKRALGGTEDMTLMETIVERLKEFFASVRELISGEDGKLDVGKAVAAGGIGAFLTNLITNIGDLGKKVGGLTGIVGTIKKFINDIGEAIGAFTLNFNIDSVKKVATAFLEIAAAMFILAMIDPNGLVRATAVVSLTFKEIEHLMQLVKKFKPDDVAALGAATAVIGSLGVSILSLSAAVYIFGTMDTGALIQGLIAVGVLMAGLTLVAKEFSKFEADIVAGAGALILFAIALDLLVIPVRSLASLSWEELAKGMLGTIGLMAALTGAAILLSKHAGEFKASTGVGLVLMAASIKILASAVKDISDISWEGIAKGLIVVAAGIAAFVIAVKVLDTGDSDKDNPVMKVAAALLIMAAAMKVLVSAISSAGSLPWDQLVQGMGALGVALVAFVAFSRIVDGKALLMAGVGILAIATAVSELVLTLNLAQAIQPIIMAITTGVQSLSNAFNSVAKDVGMKSFLDMLKSILLFLPELATGLASAIIKFVATLASGAGEIAIAVGQLVAAILGTLIGLVPQLGELLRTIIAEAVNTVITSAPQIGAAIMVVMQTVWTVLTSQIPNLFTFLGTLASEAINFLQTQGPAFIQMLFTMLGTLVSEIINFLQTQGPALLEMLRLWLDTLLQLVITEAPRIAEMLLVLLYSILAVIQTAVPEIINTLLSLLLNLLQQLALYVPQMAEAALQILEGFLQAIANNIQQITESAISIAVAFINGVAEKMPEIVDSAFKLIIGFIEGLAQAIENNHQALFDAVGHLIKAIFEAIVDGVTTIAKGAGELIGGFISEFDAGKFATDLFNAGANLVKGIIDGITGWAQNLWNEASNLAQGALNTITGAFAEHSPSKKGVVIGQYLAEGLAIGIRDGSEEVANNAGDMANAALTALSDSMDTMDDEMSSKQIKMEELINSKEFSKNLTNALVNGIREAIPEVVKAAEEMANKMLESMKEIFNSKTPTASPSITPNVDLSNMMTTLSLSMSTMMVDVNNALLTMMISVSSITNELMTKLLPILNLETIMTTFFTATTTIVSDIVTATFDLTKTLLSSMFSLVEKLSEEEMAPTITPVIDNSLIDGKGIAQIYGKVILMPATSDIQDNLTMKKQIEAKIADSITTESDYSSITNEIRLLRNDMATFSEKISQLDVILDSGVLVGELAPGIDQALGMSAILQRRGV